MTERLQTILNELNLGTRITLNDLTFNAEELLSKDDNGVTFLDTILKKGLRLNELTIDTIKHNVEIARIFCDNNRFLDFFEISEDDLFKKFNGKTYL